jgi:hypothetical protein
MKIGLRNIDHRPIQSLESYDYRGDIYINGIKAGKAVNNGYGYETNCYPTSDEGKSLMSEAEAWCRKHPHICAEDKYEVNDESKRSALSGLIDRLLTNTLKARDNEIYQARLDREMRHYILIGNLSGYFTGFNMVRPIEQLLNTAKGRDKIINTLRRSIPELNDVCKILNTNIPNSLMKAAGLKPGQYLNQKDYSKVELRRKQNICIRRGNGL